MLSGGVQLRTPTSGNGTISLYAIGNGFSGRLRSDKVPGSIGAKFVSLVDAIVGRRCSPIGGRTANIPNHAGCDPPKSGRHSSGIITAYWTTHSSLRTYAITVRQGFLHIDVTTGATGESKDFWPV